MSSSRTQNLIRSIKFNINNCNSLKRLTAIAYTLCQATLIMNGFIKVTGHLYMVKDQNGLNNALYDYYSATDNGENFTKTKKEVREMVQNIPDYYPISVVIVDLSFECNRLYLEFFDMDEVSHGSMGCP